jgi:hypothetical protein
LEEVKGVKHQAYKRSVELDRQRCEPENNCCAVWCGKVNSWEYYFESSARGTAVMKGNKNYT